MSDVRSFDARSVTLLDSISQESQDAIKGASDRLLRRASKVLRIHGRHVEFGLTYTGVHNQC